MWSIDQHRPIRIFRLSPSTRTRIFSPNKSNQRWGMMDYDLMNAVFHVRVDASLGDLIRSYLWIDQQLHLLITWLRNLFFGDESHHNQGKEKRKNTCWFHSCTSEWQKTKNTIAQWVRRKSLVDDDDAEREATNGGRKKTTERFCCIIGKTVLIHKAMA